MHVAPVTAWIQTSNRGIAEGRQTPSSHYIAWDLSSFEGVDGGGEGGGWSFEFQV